MSAIFGSDPDARCKVCGVTIFCKTGDKVPDVCLTCSNPRSLVMLMAKMRGATREQAHDLVTRYVAARGANWTRNEKQWNRSS